MTIKVEDQQQTVVQQDEVPARLGDELAYLLEIIGNRVTPGDMTPCAGCTILIPLKSNSCPHCESNIAADNALLRESLRRIAEIHAELDGEHRDHIDRERDRSARLGLWERMKRSMSGAPAVEAETPPRPDPHAPRLLDTVAVGDQVKVLEHDGPWFLVKTRDGRTGWVYSTVEIKR